MASVRERRIRNAQNFLHNRRLAVRLVGRAGIGPDDVVLEIGPGRGILTDALADRCAHLLTVEKDPEYVLWLRDRYRQQHNVSVFAGDFLDFPLPVTRYKVFANIPFNLTTRIVAKLTSGTSPPVESFLVVQREAAARFVGVPTQTLVSVQLSPWFSLSVMHAFRREDFKPVPSVDSVLLRMELRQHPALPISDRARFDNLTAALFSAWSPTVAAGLRRLLPHQAYLRLSPKLIARLEQRPGVTPVDDWLELFNALERMSSDVIWATLEERARILRTQQLSLRKEHRTRIHR